jgi:hypothetical protein
MGTFDLYVVALGLLLPGLRRPNGSRTTVRVEIMDRKFVPGATPAGRHAGDDRLSRGGDPRQTLLDHSSIAVAPVSLASDTATPPASHVARGPSGVTWLTGDSLPLDLQGKFLIANYRGPSPNCTVLTIGIEPKGAGYVAKHEEVLVKGIGASDVELGYDGKIYLCDLGGGWSINTNGAIHVLSGKGNFRELAGFGAKQLFQEGPKQMSIAELTGLLHKKDRRLRQMAQFELVARGERKALIAIAGDAKVSTTSRLHGVWGLGQLARKGQNAQPLIQLLADADPEIRANAARVLGHARVAAAGAPLIARLTDDSPRVQSLAAIALGRVAEAGDTEAVDALFQLAATLACGTRALRSTYQSRIITAGMRTGGGLSDLLKCSRQVL